MSWEIQFQENIKPVIEEYINQEASSFTSRDIAEIEPELESDEVGRTLKFADVNSILKTGNNPATWEALYTNFEGRKYLVESEVYEEESKVDEENYLERALEEVDAGSTVELYRYFRNQLNILNDTKIAKLIGEYKDEKGIREF